MARRPPEFDLVSAIADTGFTPAQSDIPALLDLLASGPADLREPTERALRRIGPTVLVPAMARAAEPTSPPEARARLVALVGRVAGSAVDPPVAAFLRLALQDPEPAVRKRAAAGLGRTLADGGDLEAVLIAALERETDAPARSAIVEALGKIGGPAAQTALAAMTSAGNLKTAAELRKARVRAARPAARSEGSMVDMARPLPAPTTLWLDARRGMLPILLEETAAFHPRLDHRIDGSAILAIDHSGPIDALFTARTWLSLSFPCPAVRRESHGDALAAAAARALTSGAARTAAALTQGPVRYRIAWAAGGKRRAMTYRVAESAAVLDPALVNDPTDAVWQVVLHETADRVAAEWIPTLDDPRFAYRTGDVPAASHPTIAAALAYLAGVEPDDIVWDPFVGSGLELCERARRGPYARLVGTDIEAAALDVARANLTAGGAERFDLRLHDAERGPPAGLRPPLVITNPPMGRRVHRSGDLRDVLARFITAVGRVLAPRGRFVWVNPFPADMRGPAERAGLTYRRGHVIDMGGFDAELQVWTK